MAARIADWTGCSPSDLDLGIGCPPERWPELLETLGAHLRFEGQRPTWEAMTVVQGVDYAVST